MIKIISFKICPFVQRVTALLEAKQIDYQVEYISLKNKPQWFVDISPNGQVPVLVTESGMALFESDAIVEYIDEIQFIVSCTIYKIHSQSLPDFVGEVAVDLAQSADTVLVFKQNQRVSAQVLDEVEATFIKQLANSDNLMQAIEALSGSIAAESLSSVVALVLQLELLQIEPIHKSE